VKRDDSLLHISCCSDVHCGRKRVVRGLRHVDVIVGVNRRFAAKRRAGELAAAVGDHFVNIHVELRAAARHPYVQREHVVMLACQDFVADLNDQIVAFLIEPLAGIVRIGSRFLQDGVGSLSAQFCPSQPGRLYLRAKGGRSSRAKFEVRAVGKGLHEAANPMSYK
jgi:hypothetical protein